MYEIDLRFKSQNFRIDIQIDLLEFFKMAYEAQSRVQNAIRDFVNEVDKKHLRGLEKDMHLCAADCCSNQAASITEVLECKERCEQKTLQSQRFVQSELERFQEVLSRCVLRFVMHFTD